MTDNTRNPACPQGLERSVLNSTFRATNGGIHKHVPRFTTLRKIPGRIENLAGITCADRTKQTSSAPLQCPSITLFPPSEHALNVESLVPLHQSATHCGEGSSHGYNPRVMGDLAKKGHKDALLTSRLVQCVDVVSIDQLVPGVAARTATPHPELRISNCEHDGIHLGHENPGYKRSMGISESQLGGAEFLPSEQPAADGDFKKIPPSPAPSIPGKKTNLADQIQEPGTVARPPAAFKPLATAEIGEAVDVGQENTHNETTVIRLLSSNTVSNLVATANTGAKPQHQSISVLDRVDSRQTSGRGIAQSFRFLDVRIRPRGAIATKRLLKDPGHWMMRLFGRFTYMRNDKTCGQTKVKMCQQFSSWFPSKPQPSYRRKARGRTANDPFTSHPLPLRDLLSISSRNSTSCQGSAQRLSLDRCAGALAKDLGMPIFPLQNRRGKLCESLNNAKSLVSVLTICF